MTLADRIRAARTQANMSQAQLAKLCGISQASLSELESGKSKSLKGNTLLRLARALGQPPEWFSEGSAFVESPSPRNPEEEKLLVEFRKLSLSEKRIVVRMIRAIAIDK